MTLTDRLVVAIIARGCVEVASNANHWRKFARPNQGGFFYVGKNGHMRMGDTLVGSSTVSDKYKTNTLGVTKDAAKPVVTTSAPYVQPVGPCCVNCGSHTLDKAFCTKLGGNYCWRCGNAKTRGLTAALASYANR